MKLKVKADGICEICNRDVPTTNSNLFYCSEGCRRKAWAIHNPNEPTPDWDSLIILWEEKYSK